MYRASTADNRTLLVTTLGSKVFGVDRADGTVRWKTELPGMSSAALVVKGDTVVVSTHDRLAILAYATGELRRMVERSDAASDVGHHAMLVDEDLVVIAGNGALVCYSLGGDLLWQQPFRGEGYGAMAMAFPC